MWNLNHAIKIALWPPPKTYLSYLAW